MALVLSLPAVILRQQGTGLRDRLNRPSGTAWAAMWTGPCDRQQIAAREVQTAEGTVAVVNWLFFLAADAPLGNRDRLRVAGVVYQIESVDRPGRPGATPHHTEALGRRVD
jgi:hypothetical protein